MKKKFLPLLILLFWLALLPTHAQKVGLVLSGGGAKGLTHIGIIRALEENNIPIDYITGTSMGAIVGSLYAMGYSPDDMLELIKSDEFKRWYTGTVEEKYIYHFRKDIPTPEFFNIHFSFRDSLKSFKPQIIPTSVVNPIQMNIVFMDLYARGTAACRGDFDKLFVPFRCVASDVYNKRQLVMNHGDLGDAVRASMSFPFVFKPIEIDSVLAYDGGIYNNFPTDVMRKDFHPDVIIGSVVSSNPTKPDEKDLMSQIENMVMQKTDYTIPDSVGILMRFKYDDISLMDFDRVDELYKRGYDRTIQLIDSIKMRIHRRISPENIRLRRMLYRSKLPELRFRHIAIEGANPRQEAYIKKEFHKKEEDVFTYEDLKRGYFRLLSDNMISEIIPHAVFDPDDNTYDLRLKVKFEDNFAVRLGGNISTANYNQIYLGLSYQDLNNYSKELVLDGQVGKVYDNLQLMGKIALPTRIPTSLRLIGSLSSFDYFRSGKLFSISGNSPAFNQKDERFVKLQLALPFFSSRRIELSVGGAQLVDKYFQKSVIDFENDRFDKSQYHLWGAAMGFNGSTLNAREHPVSGYREAFVIQGFLENERFYSGEGGSDAHYRHRDAWLQLSYMKEKYHRMGHHWTLGWYGKALYSFSKDFSENYTATMMHAAEFSPTPNSMLSYNEAFRANQFVAAGIRPIYRINQMFHVRGEFYGFMPIRPILRDAQNKALYGNVFSKVNYLGELSVVCQLPFLDISVYVNHYSSPKREWNAGLSIGWQLFNYRFIE
ncbi:MAG: patatin-like phospholipase family protein [Mediterranea sp.]|jgi:NTE family protein|nr:patatin-like phospholipase family protein [Mediterranea sp.]